MPGYFLGFQTVTLNPITTQNCPFSCLWTELGIYQQIGIFLALENANLLSTNYVIYNLNFFKSLRHIPAMLPVSREYLKYERLPGYSSLYDVLVLTTGFFTDFSG